MSEANIQQLPSGHDRVVIVAQFPQLTPEQLWQAFTDADWLTKWWAQAAVVEQPAGSPFPTSYHLQWPAMNWHLHGDYTTFEPPTKLVFTWRWDHEPDLPTRQVTIHIEPAAQGSQLQLEHGYYGDGSVEADDRQSHIDGWQFFLGQLQGLDLG